MPRPRPRKQSTRSHPVKQFRCPFGTCGRFLKTQSGWTQHVRKAHADENLHVPQNQNPTGSYSCADESPTSRDRLFVSSNLAPLALSAEMSATENGDFPPDGYEVPDMLLDGLSTPNINHLSSSPNSPCSISPSTSPSAERPAYQREYHTKLNGNVLKIPLI